MASDGEETLRRVADFAPDLIVLDVLTSPYTCRRTDIGRCPMPRPARHLDTNVLEVFL